MASNQIYQLLFVLAIILLIIFFWLFVSIRIYKYNKKHKGKIRDTTKRVFKNAYILTIVYSSIVLIQMMTSPTGLTGEGLVILLIGSVIVYHLAKDIIFTEKK
jgi:archaellum biogenesis protein FlaJ (TadC family)